MRRDMELIRELLLKLEALPMRPGTMVSFHPAGEEFAVDGYSSDEVEHHFGMIYRGGFVDYGESRMGSLDGKLYFRDLTWAGRDFLDAVREPKVWQETKGRAAKAGSWTVGILTEIAKGVIKGELAKHGVPLG